jgi:Predicted integral membrane protein (DUF2269)
MGRLIVLLHVLVAFWFVAGFLGRNLTLLGARSSADLAQVTTLTTLAVRFDQLMVIPGSAIVFVLGLLAAWAAGVPLGGSGSWWVTVSIVLYVLVSALVPAVFVPRRRVLETALVGAREQGVVTPGLHAAINDQVLWLARAVEVAVLAVIIALMVTKPF